VEAVFLVPVSVRRVFFAEINVARNIDGHIDLRKIDTSERAFGPVISENPSGIRARMKASVVARRRVLLSSGDVDPGRGNSTTKRDSRVPNTISGNCARHNCGKG
jgi:hypothetical protein